MTIIVVDDEPDYAALVAFGLRRRGHRVVVAHDGQSGLAQARRFPPDLIILDLMMPGLDGFSVCEILRCQASTKAIPIIILTAMAGELPRLHSLEAGANGFFSKGIPMRELLDQIDLLMQTEEATKRTRVKELEPNADPRNAAV